MTHAFFKTQEQKEKKEDKMNKRKQDVIDIDIDSGIKVQKLEKKPKIITCWQNKGGVGKTTCAHQLSIGLHKKGLKVLMVSF